MGVHARFGLGRAGSECIFDRAIGREAGVRDWVGRSGEFG